METLVEGCKVKYKDYESQIKYLLENGYTETEDPDWRVPEDVKTVFTHPDKPPVRISYSVFRRLKNSIGVVKSKVADEINGPGHYMVDFGYYFVASFAAWELEPITNFLNLSE